jgi:hypothetical protein
MLMEEDRFVYQSFSSSFHIDCIEENDTTDSSHVCVGCSCDYCSNSQSALTNNIKAKLDDYNNYNRMMVMLVNTNKIQNECPSDTLHMENDACSKISNDFKNNTSKKSNSYLNETDNYQTKTTNTIECVNNPTSNKCPIILENLNIGKRSMSYDCNMSSLNHICKHDSTIIKSLEPDSTREIDCGYYNLWQSELFKTRAFEKENEKLEERVKYLETKLEKETAQQIKISLEWRKTVTDLVDENKRLKSLLSSIFQVKKALSNH